MDLELMKNCWYMSFGNEKHWADFLPTCFEKLENMSENIAYQAPNIWVNLIPILFLSIMLSDCLWLLPFLLWGAWNVKGMGNHLRKCRQGQNSVQSKHRAWVSNQGSGYTCLRHLIYRPHLHEIEINNCFIYPLLFWDSLHVANPN